MLIDLLLLQIGTNDDVTTVRTKEEKADVYRKPTLYALAKTGQIRIYEVFVTDFPKDKKFEGYVVLTTLKKIGFNGKESIDNYTYTEGVNIGKSNETTYWEQACLVADSIYKNLLDSGYKETVPSKDEKFNTDSEGKIKPMLASGYSKSRVEFPCIAQPKYDGVRCTISESSGLVSVILPCRHIKP